MRVHNYVCVWNSLPPSEYITEISLSRCRIFTENNCKKKKKLKNKSVFLRILLLFPVKLTILCGIFGGS